MLILILGIAIFFTAHSVRTLAPAWREAKIESMGEMSWKGLYSVISLVGLVLIVWGFGEARQSAPVFYTPPVWVAHTALVLMAVSFVLVAEPNMKPGRIKQMVKHPMLAAIMIWSFVHLLANGDLASLILFGSFLAFSVWNRIAVTRRGDPDPVAQSSTGDIIAIVAGLGLWGLFIWKLHEWLIGVPAIA